MLSDRTVFHRSEGVTYQSLGQDQDTVILALDTGQLYACNSTAEIFLSAVDGVQTFADIVEILAEQFDAPRDQIQQDMKALAQQMINEGLLSTRQKTDA